MRISDCSSDVCSSDLTRWFSPTCLDLIGVWPRPPVSGPARSDHSRHFRGDVRPRLPWCWTQIAARDCDPHDKQFLGDNRNLSIRSLGNASRSEEHMSELQSLMRISYAVFCLKKKNSNTTITT